jgi:hypothetical protein
MLSVLKGTLHRVGCDKDPLQHAAMIFSFYPRGSKYAHRVEMNFAFAPKR